MSLSERFFCFTISYFFYKKKLTLLHSTFNFKETDNTLMVAIGLALLLVWSFFAIVIAVYALVIIPDNPSVNDCVGRVPSSNDDLDDATHKLSVTYQSIVIFFTFVLGLLFFYSSYVLFKLAADGLASFHYYFVCLFFSL